MTKRKTRSRSSSGWRVAYGITAATATIATWTVLRPYLVLTDGTPDATDPMSPTGVLVVNALLVFVIWSLVALAQILVQVARGKGSIHYN